MVIYLTGVGTLHSVLRKTREVKPEKHIRADSTRMMDVARGSEEPIVIREEDEDEDAPVDLSAIPEAPPDSGHRADEPLFLPGNDSEEDSDGDFVPFPKKRNQKEPGDDDGTKNDDKKKLRFNTDYEGFTIYDKVLCLIVTRKEKQKVKDVGAATAEGGLIEGWIVMSQAVREGESVAGGYSRTG